MQKILALVFEDCAHRACDVYMKRFKGDVNKIRYEAEDSESDEELSGGFNDSCKFESDGIGDVMSGGGVSGNVNDIVNAIIGGDKNVGHNNILHDGKERESVILNDAYKHFVEEALKWRLGIASDVNEAEENLLKILPLYDFVEYVRYDSMPNKLLETVLLSYKNRANKEYHKDDIIQKVYDSLICSYTN